MSADPIESLKVKEIGEQKSVQIRNSISRLTASLSAEGTSEIAFTVSDPGFRMNNSAYFMIRRPIVFEDDKYEITAVTANVGPGEVESVEVQARTRSIQQLKREKGATNFGAISPTQLAARKAAEKGLKFFGESSAKRGSILRRANETTDESTWDVLVALARDLEFLCFEADGTLYFASEQFIANKQQSITLNWPSQDGDRLQIVSMDLRRTDDNPIGVDATFNLLRRENAMKLRPGMVIRMGGIENFEQRLMIYLIEWTHGVPDAVTVNARTVETTEDILCESKTIKSGDTGVCVKRIQHCLGLTASGEYDYQTAQAVRKLQYKNNLPVTGIVDRATWRLVLLTTTSVELAQVELPPPPHNHPEIIAQVDAKIAAITPPP